MKKAIALGVSLLILLAALVGCSDTPNQSNEPDGNQNLTGNAQTPESPQGMIISEDEYALFQELKEERAFSVSQDNHSIKILSWKFARACLSNDTETMNDLMASDAEAGATEDIFSDELDFLILKDIQQSDNMVTLSYEFLEKGGDSYTYITMYMENIGGDWKVTFYGFEK